jgi:hypothetical membrane protein
MQKNIPFVSSKQVGNPVARWLALAGVVGPPFFVAVFTLAGFLRPGYSPIHQTVSDLGVGSNGWLVDVSCVIIGLLLSGFAVGFALSLRPELRQGWRWLIAVFLALHGLGLAIAGIFTEAPTTVAIHWLVGANLGLFGPVVAFLVVGLVLRRDTWWRGWGTSLLIAGLLTLVLLAIMVWIFTPGTLLASMRLGGLMERVVLIEIEVWYVALGWRLFVLAGSHQRAGSQQVQKSELEQQRS